MSLLERFSRYCSVVPNRYRSVVADTVNGSIGAGAIFGTATEKQLQGMDAKDTLAVPFVDCSDLAMPLTLIQIILGSSFVLIWLFIAGMIFRDGRYAIRDEEESAVLRRDFGHPTASRPHVNFETDRRSKRSRRRTSAA